MSVNASQREETPAPRMLRILSRRVAAECARLAARAIPKSYRFVLGVPMAEAAHELAELVDMAEQYVPTSPLMAHERKRCYSEVVGKSRTISRMVDACSDMRLVKASTFARVTADLEEVKRIAHGLKRSVRVRGVTSAGDLLEWYQKQLGALDALADELGTVEAREVRDAYRGRAARLARILGRAEDKENVTP